MTAAELKVLRAVAVAHVDAEVAELLHAGHRDWVLFSQDVVTRVQLVESTAAVATRAWRATCRRCSRSTAWTAPSCAG
jgi:hypothetical protein